MIWVTDATLPDYRLWVRCSDATEGEIDLRDFIASDARPIVAALRDQVAFSAIRVEMDTVVRSTAVRAECASRGTDQPSCARFWK